MSDKILILGGFGKTSKRIAPILHAAGAQLVLTSRSGKVDAPFKHEVARFDWDDPSNHAEILSNGITKVWLVTGPSADPVKQVGPFIDLAKSKGVKRIVLLSATVYHNHLPGPGEVDKYLEGSGIDYCLVKPTWFMQNFSEQEHVASIRDQDKIISATGNGRVPWVSADDIAEVATKGLLEDKARNGAYTVRGPHLLSYPDIAGILSEALNRKITHVNVTPQEYIQHFTSEGFPQSIAEFLADLEVHIAEGKEEQLDNVFEQVTGKKPRSFASFVQENLSVWQK